MGGDAYDPFAPMSQSSSKFLFLDAQDVREQMQKKEGERLKHEEQMRENQAAKDRERDEHRRQQQSAREALAMRDSFENPEADEEYDPYAFGFGDE